MKAKTITVNPTEAQEARTFMQWMKLKGLRFTHIKNESFTKWSRESGKVRNLQAVFDYQDGVSAGFPDFAIVLPGKGMLYIELKRPKGGVVSDAQAEWIEALSALPSNAAAVCRGYDEAKAMVESYLT
jgi:hypothetical protein